MDVGYIVMTDDALTKSLDTYTDKPYRRRSGNNTLRTGPTMINTPTVFILGAGASAPYRYLFLGEILTIKKQVAKTT